MFPFLIYKYPLKLNAKAVLKISQGNLSEIFDVIFIKGLNYFYGSVTYEKNY